MQQAILASTEPLSIEVKFLTEYPNGALRQPSTRRLIESNLKAIRRALTSVGPSA